MIEIMRWVALLGFGVFGVLYHVMTHGAWRRRQAGRWLMLMSITPVLFLALAVAAQTWGAQHPGVVTFRYVVLSILAALPYWLIYLLIREQKRKRRARLDP
jgi:uncharacterized membrane protein (DUF2068 family)